MLWRNPKWLRAELIWNNDCKTTCEGVKPPLMTTLMNSQKLSAKEKCICTVWQMKITWARLPGGNFLLWQSREAEQTSRMCLWYGRIHQSAQAQAQRFTPPLGADLFFPGQRRGCISLNSDTRSGFSFQLRLEARQEILPHGTWHTAQQPKLAGYLSRVGEDHSYLHAHRTLGIC